MNAQRSSALISLMVDEQQKRLNDLYNDPHADPQTIRKARNKYYALIDGLKAHVNARLNNSSNN